MQKQTLNHIGGTEDRPSLVLLHGFPFDAQIWRGQIDSIRDVARVYAPDLPGFGGSPTLAEGVEASMDAYADAVADWARDVGLDGLVLGGHSMGGYVALAFARKYPEMLRGLVLICTRPGPDTEAAREGRYKLIAEVEERGAQAVVDAMLPKLFAPDTAKRHPEVVDATLETMLRQSPQGITAALRAMAGRPDSTRNLSEIAVPTLIITGAQDAIIPAPEAEAMLAHLPGALHISIDAAGHMPMLENPSDFDSALFSFLSR